MESDFRGICWIGLLVLSGCAGLGKEDCGNAFELGQNHGVLGADESGRLAARCGSSFDAARYADGFRDGFARRGRVYAL